MSNTSEMFRRPVFTTIERRLREPRRFIQVLAGPRQAGKTTLARQVAASSELPVRFASADEPSLRDRAWLAAEWEAARELTRGRSAAILILDEIQKITGWSETVKRLWDEDTATRRPLRVLILGSAPLLVKRGVTESLAGRFEVIRVSHWSFAEMREAFGWDLDRYIFFGGYPGAASLVDDEPRWTAYIRDSLIETTISRDVLLLENVQKPALLRQLFGLACAYSGQIVALTKLVGQLQDAGNTVTLAHYLELLDGAGMVRGVQKYSGSRVRQRASSPKLLALNTALMSSTLGVSFEEARRDPAVWGRLVETAIGAHIANAEGVDLFYWRDRGREVDYVARAGPALVAIEVASGVRKDMRSGMGAFLDEYERARPVLVGAQGTRLEDFLLRGPRSIIEPQ